MEVGTRLTEPVATPEPPFEVLGAEQYYDELLEKIPQCSQRVFLESGFIVHGEKVQQLLETVADAGDRLAEVVDESAYPSVVIKTDRYLRNHFDPGRRSVSSTIVPALRKYKSSLQPHMSLAEIEARGVYVEETNGHVFGMLSPDHVKMTILDDVAYIGGVNINESNFVADDFMVRITEPKAVQVLADIFTQSDDDGEGNFREIPVSDSTSIIYDAGKSNLRKVTNRENDIFGVARDLVDDAQSSVHIISQYVPDGSMIRALRDANRRDVQTQYITRPLEYSDLFGLASRTMGTVSQFWHDQGRETTYGSKIEHPGDLHAKLLLVDRDTDEPTAIFGSHNIVSSIGPIFNQRELSIITHDPDLVAQLSKYYDGCLDRAT